MLNLKWFAQVLCQLFILINKNIIENQVSLFFI